VSEPPEVPTEPVDATNFFYTEWGAELRKGSLTFLNDVLRQMVTTSVALMSGSIAFLTDQLITRPYKLGAVLLFLLALVFAFVGVFPYRDELDRTSPAAVRRSIEGGRSWKEGWLWACAISLALGLTVAAVGVLTN
jgi:hypothetical protein